MFCPDGPILDVIVDLRIGSPTFLRWQAVQLDEAERHAVFSPPYAWWAAAWCQPRLPGPMPSCN